MQTQLNSKYTLRLNNSINRFLDWKVQNTKLSKAEYIRLEILKMISSDLEYQNFMKKFVF